MIKEAIQVIISGRSLSAEEASSVMSEIMDGQATPAQFGAFVTALRLKGESVSEIVGLARTMRARAVPVNSTRPLVDTCGTGGDGARTFNISTAAAIVAAACGIRVAKHGSRAVASTCGSADVLEALGVNISLPPAGVEYCLERVGVAFLFAPVFHPAMKYAAAPRKEIGIRTVFNLLGPLVNPAGARAQLIGVADESMLKKIALVLKELGSQHALIVHGNDGLDEITVTGESRICELKEGIVEIYAVRPEYVGLARHLPEDLRGGSVADNAAAMR